MLITAFEDPNESSPQLTNYLGKKCADYLEHLLQTVGVPASAIYKSIVVGPVQDGLIGELTVELIGGQLSPCPYTRTDGGFWFQIQ